MKLLESARPRLGEASPRKNKGFTIIELLVSVAIFGIITALVIAKYGNFNQSVLLTNLAYEVALTVRTAQTYGLSVKSSASGLQQFDAAYGVVFNKTTNDLYCGSESANNTKFVLFADTSPSPISDGLCTNDDVSVDDYAIKRGAVVGSICVGSDESCPVETDTVDITFKRPDPDAIIRDTAGDVYKYVKITLVAVDGSTRDVVVYGNGQISVKD